jgi:hypothetical protein
MTTAPHDYAERAVRAFTCFNHRKSEQELGLSFRGLERTFADTVAWYQEHDGFKKNKDEKQR